MPSGTYYIHASAPAFLVDRHKAKLRNTTDNSDTIIGTSENAHSSYSIMTHSFVIGRFTIAAQKNFELQHRCQTTRGDDGFGRPSNFSVVEVYTDVRIWKIS